MSGKNLIAFCALAVIWGTTWLAIKAVVEEMPPITSAGVRFLFATLLLVAYARLRRQSLALAQLTHSQRQAVLALSLVMIALPYALIFYAEQFISSALTAILFACHPAIVLLFDSLYARRSLFAPRNLAGLSASCLGLWIIFAPRLAGPHTELRGAVAILLAAILSSFAVVLAKYGAQEIDPVVSTTWQMAGGAVWLLLAGILLEQPTWGSYSVAAWLALTYLTVLGSSVAFVLYYMLLRHIAPVQASSLSFITPVVAVLAGWAVLGEVLSRRTLLGAAIVLTGVALVHRRVEEPGLFPRVGSGQAGD